MYIDDTLHLLTEVQAARRLGMSVRWIQASRVTGDGPPFIRISRRAIRYRTGDLEQWVQERVRHSTSESNPA